MRNLPFSADVRAAPSSSTLRLEFFSRAIRAGSLGKELRTVK